MGPERQPADSSSAAAIAKSTHEPGSPDHPDTFGFADEIDLLDAIYQLLVDFYSA
jgi:hypothetical protein